MSTTAGVNNNFGVSGKNTASTTGAFTYATEPRALKPGGAGKSGLYRDSNNNNNKNSNNKTSDPSLTLMSDPRVVRGSSYDMTLKKNSHSKSNSLKGLDALNQAAQLAKENEMKLAASYSKSSEDRPMYTFTVPTFASSDLDLSSYLIEKLPPPSLGNGLKVAECQTDVFKPRPRTPPYIPAKTGIDVSTQVDDVRELFIFDKEVKH